MAERVRDFTPEEWSFLRKCANQGMRCEEASTALATKRNVYFSPDVIRKRGRTYGLNFSSRSAHRGTSRLTMGHNEEMAFERAHPANAGAADC